MTGARCTNMIGRLIALVVPVLLASAVPAQQPLPEDQQSQANMPNDSIHRGMPAQDAHQQPAQPNPSQLMNAWSDDFAEQVDISPLGSIAVQYQGRIKSFDSHAAQMMQYLTGPHQVDGQSDIFTYLDLIFRPAQYEGRDIVYVKKAVRPQIAQALLNDPLLPQSDRFKQRIDDFLDSGLIAPDLLERDSVREVRQQLSRDLIRTAKFANKIDDALAVREGNILVDAWRIVPPTQGGTEQLWLNPLELMNHEPGSEPGKLSPEDHRRAVELIEDFVNAWLNGNADGVNRAAEKLAAFLPAINPGVYPDKSRLGWESWYFNAPWYVGGPNMTGIWVLYALSMIPLLLSIVFRWPGARIVGMVMFLLAFALHTFAIGLRWYVAQRWPNTNMFEAVTTAAWFGGCGAIFMELIVRRRAMAGLFALGSAAGSMVALMCAYYMPMALDPNISNKMPVLHDVWLYIHTNVIIFSYALIFMAAISAFLYLGRRLILALMGRSGTFEYAKVGGAGSLMMTGPGAVQLTKKRTTLGQVLDGTTMILMESSFVLLWAGLVMGAIWADHSWGRPWGWDPKEGFALNTFIVFAILIHVRKKVRDKGLYTALLAVFGAAVMLFNWIVINFHIVGLHSYA